MPPQKYLFHVNSGTGLSSTLWKEFYMTEHLPDVVESGCAVRASFYEEIPTPFNATPDHHRNFLATYQSQYPELMKAEGHHQVRTTSGLFAKEGSETDVIMVNGDFSGRNYELVQDYDPLGTGEKAPPQILTVEMHPQNPEDFDRWYREEHLAMLQKVPGYRRSLRYKLGPNSGFMKEGFNPDYLAIHEVDDVSQAFGGEEAEAANTTAWTVKQLENSKVLIVRGWKLVYALGHWEGK